MKWPHLCWQSCATLVLACLSSLVFAQTDTQSHTDSAHAVLDTYCSRCHNDERMSGNWSLSMVNPTDIGSGQNLESWEKILRMTRSGDMPPADRPQLPSNQKQAFIQWLETELDEYSSNHPNPGRATLRRLNRAEYSNAVRDLLAIDVEIQDQLPADDAGYGFDNIADVLTVSATLMDRYLSLAGKISALAVAPHRQSLRLPATRCQKTGQFLIRGCRRTTSV